MVTLEQVEKLCERADISYDEAKELLEAKNGDMLEAVISLEKEGRIQAPKSNGFFNSAASRPVDDSGYHDAPPRGKHVENEGTSVGESMGGFFRWCGKILHIGNINNFEVTRNGERVVMFPITGLALLLLFAFWITIPLLVIGLFFGYRYMFVGPDMNKTQVNRAMDTMAEAAEDFKNKVKEEYRDE